MAIKLCAYFRYVSGNGLTMKNDTEIFYFFGPGYRFSIQYYVTMRRD